MALDAEQRTRLKAGMSRAFQDFDVLKNFIEDNCGRQITLMMNAESGLLANFSAVIGWAESDGWLDDLLDKLALHGNPTLRREADAIARDFAARRSIFVQQMPIDPLSALFIAREECFIGRSDLRNSLRELRSDDSNRHVLIVTGQSSCGKSFSFQLLRVLDKMSTSNVVVLIDFKQFREGALAERYRDIVNQINTRLDVPYDQILPHNESEARWFEHAIRKFDNVVRDRGKKLWLVFDHIRSGAGIEPSIADALASLTTYALGVSHVLRIVLIDVDPSDLKLNKPIHKKLITDSALLPTRPEITAFLQQARLAARMHDVEDKAIDDAADEIMSYLAGLDLEEVPYSMSEATWQHAVKLGFVA